MPYHIGELRAAMRKIMGACPDVVLENWADYGFRLDGYKRDEQRNTIPSTIRIIFQPARPDNGQPEIIADVDAIIEFWRKIP